MQATPLYNTICTDKFVKTVNFYEDFFGYAPIYETETYVVLEHSGGTKDRIAIMDFNDSAAPKREDVKPGGLMLNLAVKDIEDSFEHYYYEGLDILSEMAQADCGRRFFALRDPSGNIINMVEESREAVVTFPDNAPPSKEMELATA